jgi:hypothetical protein
MRDKEIKRSGGQLPIMIASSAQAEQRPMQMPEAVRVSVAEAMLRRSRR